MVALEPARRMAHALLAALLGYLALDALGAVPGLLAIAPAGVETAGRAHLFAALCGVCAGMLARDSGAAFLRSAEPKHC